jgi:hypothetical protein
MWIFNFSRLYLLRESEFHDCFGRYTSHNLLDYSLKKIGFWLAVSSATSIINFINFWKVNYKLPINRILNILFLGLTPDIPRDKVSPKNKMPNILYVISVLSIHGHTRSRVPLRTRFMPSFEYYKWIINRQERFNIGSFRKNMWIFNFNRLYLLRESEFHDCFGVVVTCLTRFLVFDPVPSIRIPGVFLHVATGTINVV